MIKPNEVTPDMFANVPTVGKVDLGVSEEMTESVANKMLARALELARYIDQADRRAGMDKWFPATGDYSIYNMPKHKAFFDAGAEYDERMFLAANRVGKSIAGAYEVACHLTGNYPSWWAGRVFDHPIDAWVVGPDARTVRDTIQKELLGSVGEEGTGMIPAHALGKSTSLQGTPGAIDTIKVKHISGGWSTIGFKNYKQDIQAFMGTARHVIWCDEECPIEIWNECNIRTATTKGIMLATFTPLEGLTRMVINFCKNADFLLGAKPIAGLTVEDDEENETVAAYKSKAVVQAGWDDAPWLTEDVKARLLSDTPEHLRDARSKGIPTMGAGNVFATPIESVTVPPFAIPDNWPRMYALDVGWNRTAALWAALDPNSDTLYLYDEHYKGEQEPFHHAYAIKSRGEWVQGVIDPATRGRSQVDGTKLYSLYKQLGLKLFLAKNEREAGISAIAQRLSTGKLKVFSTLRDFPKEYMLYRRDTRGRVIDENDHLMDCMRYIINNMNRMSSNRPNGPIPGLTYTETKYDI